MTEEIDDVYTFLVFEADNSVTGALMVLADDAVNAARVWFAEDDSRSTKVASVLPYDLARNFQIDVVELLDAPKPPPLTLKDNE